MKNKNYEYIYRLLILHNYNRANLIPTFSCHNFDIAHCYYKMVDYSLDYTQPFDYSTSSPNSMAVGKIVAACLEVVDLMVQ